MALTQFQRRVRIIVKRFVYSQLYLRESLFILLGRSKPLVRFTVESSPPSLYLNFAIRPDKLAALEQRLAPLSRADTASVYRIRAAVSLPDVERLSRFRPGQRTACRMIGVRPRLV